MSCLFMGYHWKPLGGYHIRTIPHAILGLLAEGRMARVAMLASTKVVTCSDSHAMRDRMQVNLEGGDREGDDWGCPRELLLGWFFSTFQK